MRSAAVLAGVTAMAMTGCGGSGSSSTSHAASGSHAHHSRILTFHLKMTGKAEVPPGAPKGRGRVVVAFHGSTKVCWHFSHLHGFSGAMLAHIHKGAAGTAGPVVIPLSTGAKFKHKGCLKAPSSVIKAIEQDPRGYYVNVHSRKYPGGAVRAQL